MAVARTASALPDDKQGIAVILHVMQMLKAMNFDEYGVVTVLINGDEEISSPGSRSTLTRLGGEHDAVLSFEATRPNSEQLSLATAGIAAVTLKVKGKASHAGSAPELGRNALYELAHQIMQMRDLSDQATGAKMNRTIAKGAELGKELKVFETAEGGGTDAAFAALKTKAPVIERFGLMGFGAHSNDAEYIFIDSIEPRRYLAARMIIDIARGKAQ